ncbi:MAG: molecular chaperone HtpG [Gammaproteobacteria bacterium]
MQAEKQTHVFNAEVKQLLKMMIHSLYSDKEIFLRELISNASDALDKVRFEALDNKNIVAGQPAIRVIPDKVARTITITDNGIGMSEAEVIEHLGTIAKSGTKSFLEKLTGEQSKDAQLIGQFGVGFYASFMVADKVTVLTRRADAGADEAVLWESNGEGAYDVSAAHKNDVGTSVTLHMKENEDELLEDWKLREIITKYSDHIFFPVEMQLHQAEEDKTEDSPVVFEAVNKANALWTRPKSSITDEDYQAFYKHVSHDFDDPLCWTHNRVEGKTEYTNLLYIPKRAPFDLFQANMKRHGIKLYVKRVFIMDDAEQFMPNYLRFVKGVIDAADLPLNVSREILQQNKVVDTIRAGSVKKVLGLLEDLAKNHPEKYLAFWAEFGNALKEGPIEDHANKEQVAQLLRFATTLKNDKTQSESLDDYISRMKPEQSKIYYVTADTFQAASHSPHLEIFRKKGIEVLLLSDRVDEWLVTHLPEYKGKAFESVSKGTLDLGDLKDNEDAASPEQDASFTDLLNAFKLALDGEVKDVRLTHRLTDSPACVVADANDMGLQLQRLFKSAGQAIPGSKPILELNPTHPLLVRLQKQASDPVIADWAHVLLGQAILAEGGQLEDPASFVKKMNGLMV